MRCCRESPARSGSTRLGSHRASQAGGMTGASQKMFKTPSPPEAGARRGASSYRKAARSIRSRERSPMRPSSNSLNWRVRKSKPLRRHLDNLRTAFSQVFAYPWYIALAGALAIAVFLLAVWFPNLGLIAQVFTDSDAPLAATLGIAL